MLFRVAPAGVEYGETKAGTSKWLHCVHYSSSSGFFGGGGVGRKKIDSAETSSFGSTASARRICFGGGVGVTGTARRTGLSDSGITGSAFSTGLSRGRSLVSVFGAGRVASGSTASAFKTGFVGSGRLLSASDFSTGFGFTVERTAL